MQNDEIIRVQNSSTLVRDKISRAILNINQKDRELYLSRKNAIRSKDMIIEQLQNKIDRLESAISDLEQRLLKIENKL